MTKKLLFVMTILLVVTFVALAADVSGKWTYQQAGFNGGDPIAITITLKADGATLTGSVPAMMGGRGGGGGGTPPAPSEISNGKVDGSKVYFEVKRTTQRGESITKYEGTVNGDAMTLKITRPGRGGGDPMVTEVTANREKS
jgi:hypothetical protein